MICAFDVRVSDSQPEAAADAPGADTDMTLPVFP